jgi:hypothetical protein
MGRRRFRVGSFRLAKSEFLVVFRGGFVFVLRAEDGRKEETVSDGFASEEASTEKTTDLLIVLRSIIAILLVLVLILFSVSRIVLLSTVMMLLLLSSRLSLSERGSHRRRWWRSEVIRSDEESVSIELDRAWEGSWAGWRRDRSVPVRGGVLLLMIGVLLELVVVGVVEDLELFLDGSPERKETETGDSSQLRGSRAISETIGKSMY